MSGEAGFQPNLLRGGWHFLTPFHYRIHKMPLVTIPQGKIGYGFARDGKDLPPTQALASTAHGADFQDLVAFLQNGGEKGPQRQILREGKAQQQAAQIQTLAGAEAEKVRLMGEGEAKRIKVMAEAQAEQAARVGIAQAMAIEE